MAPAGSPYIVGSRVRWHGRPPLDGTDRLFDHMWAVFDPLPFAVRPPSPVDRRVYRVDRVEWADPLHRQAISDAVRPVVKRPVWWYQDLRVNIRVARLLIRHQRTRRARARVVAGWVGKLVRGWLSVRVRRLTGQRGLSAATFEAAKHSRQAAAFDVVAVATPADIFGPSADEILKVVHRLAQLTPADAGRLVRWLSSEPWDSRWPERRQVAERLYTNRQAAAFRPGPQRMNPPERWMAVSLIESLAARGDGLDGRGHETWLRDEWHELAAAVRDATDAARLPLSPAERELLQAPWISALAMLEKESSTAPAI